jgi:hypothetical protein
MFFFSVLHSDLLRCTGVGRGNRARLEGGFWGCVIALGVRYTLSLRQPVTKAVCRLVKWPSV